MNHLDNIRILMVEDHPLYRLGLRMSLTYTDSQFTILKEAENVLMARDFIQQYADGIDLILLDYFLPDGTGLDVIHQAKQYCPDAKILVISAENHNPDTAQLLEAGINGFISKDIASVELTYIINSVMAGQDCFDSGMIKQPEPSAGSNDDELTLREIEIIQLSAQGLSAKQVAAKLGISVRTVEKHKDRIFNKLDINTTVELTNYAIRKGLI